MDWTVAVCQDLVAVAPRGGERALRLRSPVWSRRPRGFATAKTQQYHAQAGGLGVPAMQQFPALTERTLALVPRAKYPHCSARARDGLVSLGRVNVVSLFRYASK